MSEKPNLLFILNDHQAWYGHNRKESAGPLRPCFDEWVKEGIEFSNTYCVTPMCGPTRRSLLTGLYPHTHGQYHNETDPPYRHEVYLDTLAEAGYRNYYYGKWHAGPGCAYDHHCDGFSMSGYGNAYNTPVYKDYLKRKGLPKAEHFIERVFENDSFKRNRYFQKLKEGGYYQCEDFFSGEHAIGVTVTPKETHESFFLAALACEKLEEIAESRRHEPFAMRIDFWGPHQPFFPTKEFLDMYDPSKILPYPSFYNKLEDKPFTVKAERNKPMGDGKTIIYPNPIGWNEWQNILAHCYAHGSMIDAAGGMIIKKLKELNLDEDTLIVWTTDHGDSIACQGGHFDKGSNMMQEIMRVPLGISWKNRIGSGLKDGSLVFTCDIPVTLLDTAGLSFRESVDGRSLLDLALGRNNRKPWRNSLLCETYGHGYGHTQYGRMAVRDNIKYVCTQNDLDELYDLEQDPYELRNLAVLPEYADLKNEMRNLLRELQKETEDPISPEALMSACL